METSQSPELFDSRRPNERGRQNAVLIILWSAAVATLIVVYLCGQFDNLAVMLFGFPLAWVLLLRHIGPHWAIVGYDQEGLSAVCEGEEIRVPLASIKSLNWSDDKKISLQSSDGRTLRPGSAADETSRLRLYRFLRDHLPEEIQRNWPQFCKRRLPQREIWQRHATEGMASYEFLMTRRRYDWHWWWAIPLTILDGVLMAAVTEDWYAGAICFAAMFLLFALLRWNIPAEGRIQRKWSLGNWWLPVLLAPGHLFIFAIVAGLLALRSESPGAVAAGKELMGWIALSMRVGQVLFFVILLAYSWRHDRRYPLRNAGEMWDKLDEELFGQEKLLRDMHGNAAEG